MPLGIGPLGTKIAGRCPKRSAPMTSPGTILSQIPSSAIPSYIWWLSATAVAKAMASRLKRLSSMPSCPCVTPSHIAGVPPATCAVAPTSRAQIFMRSG